MTGRGAGARRLQLLLTLGVALTPSRDFSATLDYFDIQVDDFIYGGTPRVTLRRCLDTGD
jgi:hypothetical protein